MTVPAATLSASGGISGSAPNTWRVNALLWNPYALQFEPITYETTSNGSYSLTGLPPGEYIVKYVPPAAGTPASYWKKTIRIPQSRPVVVKPGQTTPGISEPGMSLTRESQRVAGTNRYDTSALMSSLGFHEPETVFIANSTGFADGLSGAPAAATLGAPLLLTAVDALSTHVTEELQRLTPRKVVILGGPTSVSDDVEDEIATAVPDAEITRIAGTDRYDTSRKLARFAFAGYDTHTAYMVIGSDFPDGIAAGSSAAAQHAPVILDNGSTSLDSATSTLIQELGIERIVIVGSSIPTAKETTLRGLAGVTSVIRIAGANRYETSAQLITFAFPQGADTALITNGTDYVDALGGITLAAEWDVPVFITSPSCMPSAIGGKLSGLRVTEFYILGNNNTLSSAMEDFTIC
ncbi:putative cell wall-binding protein [Leifsonia sp. AK011]|uniref:cell wall-binding repeat-containing protein n=1 Tax=Leifsonia sp. AK011 TaxID=2723075 RepID=UPI0015CE4162|nr:cell wall-binding repeat-containing protein [Leifsonia sp. AK011]NYF11360.1 putative cell wall-binding protein [Leifsonia sp. AK011]